MDESVQKTNTSLLSVPETLRKKSSKQLKPRLESEIKRYKFAIRELKQCIDGLGNADEDLDNLEDDNAGFLKMEILERKLLKARNALFILERRLALLSSEEKIDTPSSSAASSRPIEALVRYKGSGHDSIDQAVTKFINRRKLKQNAETSIDLSKAFYEFPSVPDIFSIISKQNQCNKLNISDDTAKELSKKVCEEVVIVLKQKTVAERKQFLADKLENSVDPAVSDAELERKLTENKRLALISEQRALDAFRQVIAEAPEEISLPEFVQHESEEILLENASIMSTSGNSSVEKSGPKLEVEEMSLQPAENCKEESTNTTQASSIDVLNFFDTMAPNECDFKEKNDCRPENIVLIDLDEPQCVNTTNSVRSAKTPKLDVEQKEIEVVYLDDD